MNKDIYFSNIIVCSTVTVLHFNSVTTYNITDFSCLQTYVTSTITSRAKAHLVSYGKVHDLRM